MAKVNGDGGGASVFPEDVWETIFTNLTDLTDIRNCRGTCRLFHHILVSSNRRIWLFDLVFPHLFPYLDRSSILACRAVCKLWNGGVDAFFQNHLSLQPFSGDHDPKRAILMTPMRASGVGLYEFGKMDLRVRSFVERMRDHPRNPFIGRHLIVREWYGADRTDPLFEDDDFNEEMYWSSSNDEGSDDDQGGWFINDEGHLELERPDFDPARYWIAGEKRRFWNVFNRFMRNFGSHLWYLTFSADAAAQRREGSHLSAAFNFLSKELFRLSPDLKMLRIRGRIDDWIGDGEFGDFEINAGTVALGNKLETMIIDDLFEDGNSQPVPQAIVEAHQAQLKCLRVPFPTWKNLTELELPFLKLKELHLSHISSAEELRSFHALASLPGLKKLGLGLKVTNKPMFQSLLQLLTGLGGTLQVLRISDGFPELEPAPTLQAPATLKTLEVQHSLKCSYAFLLHFPFLENLVIYWPRVRDEVDIELMMEDQLFKRASVLHKEEKVEVHRFAPRRMYESNIWLKLPQLKVLTVQNEVYTRPGYTQFIEKKNAAPVVEEGAEVAAGLNQLKL